MKTLAALIVVLASGCVAQVRDVRIQKPFWEAPPETKISLVSVDVPPWLEETAQKTGDARALLKEAVASGFSGKAFKAADQTDAGAVIAIWPESAPIIQPTASSLAEVGRPYPFDADGMAHAVGAPPIQWSVGAAPDGFSIDAAGHVSWTPQKTGSEEVELIAKNPLGETKYRFSVSVGESGSAGKVQLAQPGAPSIPPNCPFGATMPANLPGSVDGSLLLGIYLVDWRANVGATVPMIQRGAYSDVVYTLWTRSGQVVETRRVRMDQHAGSSFRNTPVFVPDRSHDLLWTHARRLPVEFGSWNEKLIKSMATMTVAAFAWPYGEHEAEISVQLDESSPALKEGIALSDKQDWEGAYQSFDKVAKATPDLAGAYYNMGVMREVQGRDAEAADLYKKALAIRADGMYQRELDVVQHRMRSYRKIDLEAAPVEK